MEALEPQDLPVTGQPSHEHLSVEGISSHQTRESFQRREISEEKPLVPHSSGPGLKQGVGWAAQPMNPRRKWRTGLGLGCHKQVTLVMLALGSPGVDEL